jgi:riboflavin kinase/FMN adenylyltransferase
MKYLYQFEDLASVPGPTHLAIGVFDGVHLGHQAVIGRAVRNARQTGGSAVVVTFDPHPVRVLRPEKAPRLLTAPSQKGRLIEELGVDATLTIAFTREFSETSPELFVQTLDNAANELREICVGADWRFGANRSGGMDLLEAMARRREIKINAVSPVLIGDRAVSSTRVRLALDRGDLNEASRLLGRPFALCGIVARAGALGDQLDVAENCSDPNANQFPPDGLYAVEAGRGGKGYRGAVNIGWTQAGQQIERLLQLQLLGPRTQISDGEIELSLLQYLGPHTAVGGFSQQVVRDALWAKEIDDMERRVEEGSEFCEPVF